MIECCEISRVGGGGSFQIEDVTKFEKKLLQFFLNGLAHFMMMLNLITPNDYTYYFRETACKKRYAQFCERLGPTLPEFKREETFVICSFNFPGT